VTDISAFLSLFWISSDICFALLPVSESYFQIPDTESQSQKSTDQLQIWQSQIPDMESQIPDMRIQISDTHLQFPGQIACVSDISGIQCPQIQMKYLVSGNLYLSVSARALTNIYADQAAGAVAA